MQQRFALQDPSQEPRPRSSHASCSTFFLSVRLGATHREMVRSCYAQIGFLRWARAISPDKTRGVPERNVGNGTGRRRIGRRRLTEHIQAPEDESFTFECSVV